MNRARRTHLCLKKVSHRRRTVHLVYRQAVYSRSGLLKDWLKRTQTGHFPAFFWAMSASVLLILPARLTLVPVSLFRLMALLLSLDTSTTVCSVALHRQNDSLPPALLGCYELFIERTSSAMLTTLINDLVGQAGYTLRELDAVAVAKGPGSYTGLRISVSTAKGLCFALDKPLLAVNTLTAMAEQVRAYFPENHLLCPMIDARRMEVYCALYDTSGREVQPTAAKIIDEQSFTDQLTERPIVFFGDGAEKCRPTLGVHPSAIFPASVVLPSARTIGQLALEAFSQQQFEDVATFEPFYLKDFMTIKPKKAPF